MLGRHRSTIKLVAKILLFVVLGTVFTLMIVFPDYQFMFPAIMAILAIIAKNTQQKP